ncbi:hypothetical protein [Microbacterium profundi]|nr:hypothetical protein [Microbacterium profundi]
MSEQVCSVLGLAHAPFEVTQEIDGVVFNDDFDPIANLWREWSLALQWS